MSAFYEHAEKSRGAQRILSCSVMQRTAAWSQNGTGAGHGPGSVLDPPLPVDLWRQSFRGTTATGLAQPMVPRRLRNHVTWPGYRAAASGAAGGTVSKKRIDPFTAPSTGQSCEFAGRPRLAGEWPIPRSAVHGVVVAVGGAARPTQRSYPRRNPRTDYYSSELLFAARSFLLARRSLRKSPARHLTGR